MRQPPETDLENFLRLSDFALDIVPFVYDTILSSNCSFATVAVDWRPTAGEQPRRIAEVPRAPQMTMVNGRMDDRRGGRMSIAAWNGMSIVCCYAPCLSGRTLCIAK